MQYFSKQLGVDGKYHLTWIISLMIPRCHCPPGGAISGAKEEFFCLRLMKRTEYTINALPLTKYMLCFKFFLGLNRLIFLFFFFFFFGGGGGVW